MAINWEKGLNELGAGFLRQARGEQRLDYCLLRGEP